MPSGSQEHYVAAGRFDKARELGWEEDELNDEQHRGAASATSGVLLLSCWPVRAVGMHKLKDALRALPDALPDAAYVVASLAEPPSASCAAGSFIATKVRHGT